MSYPDRLMQSLRSLIREEMPQLTYGAVWEYTVTSVNDDGSLNGTPTGDYPLPALNRVPFGALASGGVSEPGIGSMFLVEFFDQDGSQYAVISVQPTVRVATLDATQGIGIGPSATLVKLGPSPSKSVARAGDSIQAFFPIGLLNGTHSSTGPVTNLPCSILTPAPGVITSGSLKVFS